MIAQIAMLLSNYQLLTLYNNLLDIIALIYINLVNIVGALSKWKKLYQLPYFYSFGNHFTCSFHPTLLTISIKRMIALQYYHMYKIHLFFWIFILFNEGPCLCFKYTKSPWWNKFNISYIPEPCTSTHTIVK